MLEPETLSVILPYFAAPLSENSWTIFNPHVFLSSLTAVKLWKVLVNPHTIYNL